MREYLFQNSSVQLVQSYFCWLRVDKRNFNSLESAYQQQQAIDTFFEYTLKPKENAA